eukprot:3705120-Amphidinium_carterae.1
MSSIPFCALTHSCRVVSVLSNEPVVPIGLDSLQSPVEVDACNTMHHESNTSSLRMYQDDNSYDSPQEVATATSLPNHQQNTPSYPASDTDA